MENIELVWCSPKDYQNNPVLKPEESWEFNATGDPYAAPFSGGVWYDDEDQLFKMWYSAGGGLNNGLLTCYATSIDGVNWTRPNLDVVPGTNIVDTMEHDCCTVLLDRHETDRTKRYKMFNVRFDKPTAVSMVLKYSADGIHWSDPVAVSGDLLDRCSAYYDPFRQEYVLSLKTKDEDNRRARNFLSNADPELAVSLAHRLYDNKYDKYIRFWFSADEDDPRHPDFPEIVPAIYNHDATAYENTLLGQFCVWQGPENKDCTRLQVQKRNEILIGFSYDGFNWDRRNKTPFIGVDLDPKSWKAGNIQSVAGAPVIVGDSLYVYYSGRYNSRPEHASNFSTGLAKLRRDGFVKATTLNHSASNNAKGSKGNKKGVIRTQPITVEGEYMFVNVDTSGKKSQLKIELFNKEGNPLDTMEAIIKDTNSTCLPVKWASGKNLENYKDQDIIFHFTLTNCELYSFWTTPFPSGESGGYTAGGGPGLHPSGKDIPTNAAYNW